MILRTLGLLIAAFVPWSSLAADAGGAAPLRRARRASISPTISQRGAGGVQLGMSLAEVRSRLNGAKLLRDRDAEGRALVAVTRSKRTLMLLDANEPDPALAIDWNARVDWITVVDPAYVTREGVRTGMRLNDVEKRFGALRDIHMSEIESREYAHFTSTPKNFWLRVVADSGTAGIYPASASSPPARTRRYRPDARILYIEVSSQSRD